MRRPASIHRTAKSTFRPEIAQGLVDYFRESLALGQQARASGGTSPVKFPTVVGYCRMAKINHNTAQVWGQRYPEMRQALVDAATIRLEFSKLELPELVFDTEVQP